MSALSLDKQRLTKAEQQLTWLREHAELLRKMTEAPWVELINVRVWRALLIVDNEVVAVSIHQQEGKLLLGQVQRQFQQKAGDSVQHISGASLTMEELALFLGLHKVSPKSFSWHRQVFDTSGIVVMKGSLDGLVKTG